MAHPWVNEDYDGPPPSYIPERPILTDPEQLTKDIVNRLQIFGYKLEEIHAAFSPEQDHSQPHPIRATYHLLSEMVARERGRMMAEQRRKMSQLGIHHPKRAPTGSMPHLGKSLPCITESNSPAPLYSTPSGSQLEPDHTNQRDEHYRAAQYGTKESTRRASTADTSRHIPQRYAPENQSALSNPSQERPTTGDPHRRQSVPINQLPDNWEVHKNTKRPSATEKLKEELRTVSGWFLNVTTTSSKPADELLDQLAQVLKDHGVEYNQEGQYLFNCNVNMNASKHAVDAMDECDPDNSHSSWFKGKPQHVGFQVEICQVPRMKLHGLHFKRLSGGVWNYKKICGKILSNMNL